MSPSSTTSDFTSNNDASALDLSSPLGDFFVNEYLDHSESKTKYDLSTTTENEDVVHDPELSNNGNGLFVPTDQDRSASTKSNVREEEREGEEDRGRSDKVEEEEEEYDRCECGYCYET
jgi:hypothetical protein